MMSTRQDTISTFEERKEQLRQLHAEHEAAGKSVSGVVVAEKIGNSLIKGNLESAFDKPQDAQTYREQMQELAETVQRAEAVRNNVTISTVPPTTKLVPGKMIVINLPGNGTSLSDNDRNPLKEARVKVAAERGVSEFFDFIREDVAIKPQDCQTVGCYYSHKVNEMIDEYNERGTLHAGIEEFSNIFDDLISKDGKKINAQEAVRNMQNVVLRAQCFGTLVASELEEYLHIKLAVLGYTDKECAEILSAPTALFSSSPVALDRQPRFFKTVAYANAADTLIPTVKGSPDYKKVVGFKAEDVQSENRQLKTIEIRKNYQLTVCSSLDFPTLSDLREYVVQTYHLSDEVQINAHIETILKGHAFSAVSNPLNKDSIFMQTLRESVKNMMSKSVQQVSEHYYYRVGKLEKRPKSFDLPQLKAAQNQHSATR
ncbi:MAG: hypothetical protein IKR60_02065 [Alphaproteobacteria bacterium]|nr:hypothetical protein [Alphaproteobacteria bacterium]